MYSENCAFKRNLNSTTVTGLSQPANLYASLEDKTIQLLQVFTSLAIGFLGTRSC